MTEPGGARTALRAATRAEHERLDALMSGFDLADAATYRAFLAAHAMAFPAVEAALDVGGFAAELDDWAERRRAAAIADDLAALGAPVPDPLPFAPLATAGARWGAAYVLEGSRLGGTFLARQIGEGLPRSYLGTPQAPGKWRTFLEKLDKALGLPQEAADAQAAARAVFALFEEAGRRQMERV